MLLSNRKVLTPALASTEYVLLGPNHRRKTLLISPPVTGNGYILFGEGTNNGFADLTLVTNGGAGQTILRYEEFGDFMQQQVRAITDVAGVGGAMAVVEIIETPWTGED